MRIDLTGQTFGRWTVIGPSGSRAKDRSLIWVCKCICGTIKEVGRGSLRSANSKSCGCFRAEALSKRATHGHTKSGHRTSEYIMWKSARHRALINNVSFNIELIDIIIPKFCPVLNIELDRTHSKSHDNSPSLDRIVPSLGYTKGNVVVISHRANTIKNKATWQELLRVSEWLKGELQCKEKTNSLKVGAS
jgi:hypothetical protein